MQKREGANESKPNETTQSGTANRRERRKAEMRERLFEAALTLLSERDFDAVTVEMITESADVGKGTFFNYFGSKEALIVHFIETQTRLFAESVSAKHRQPASPGSLLENILALTRPIAERDSRSPLLARTLISLILTHPAVRAAHLDAQARTAVLGVEIIRGGQQHGELRADLPPEIILNYFMDVYFQTLFSWSVGESGESLYESLERAYRLALEGVGAKKANASS